MDVGLGFSLSGGMRFYFSHISKSMTRIKVVPMIPERLLLLAMYWQPMRYHSHRPFCIHILFPLCSRASVAFVLMSVSITCLWDINAYFNISPTMHYSKQVIL